MAAYYNEYDPKAAAWLRELIKQGHIADGVVDDRSIEDVRPIELAGFTQCHFFAGIGVWSYALRRAGWADDRPVWTGSCPCQPFSAAGKGAGFDDERHLWPAFHHLISQCQPAIVLGEQVASKDGLGWLDLVHADLEATGYASGAVDLCAAGVGAPHIRQRLWWVGERLGNPDNARRERDVLHPLWGGRNRGGPDGGIAGSSATGDMADTSITGLQGREWVGPTGTQGRPSGYGSECSGVDGLDNSNHAGQQAERTSTIGDGSQPEAVIRGAAIGLADTTIFGRGEGVADDGGLRGGDSAEGQVGRSAVNCDMGSGLADTKRTGFRDCGCGVDEEEARGEQGEERQRERIWSVSGANGSDGGSARPSPTNGHWRDADWLFCRDGKWRPVEPGTSPLAHGASDSLANVLSICKVASYRVEEYANRSQTNPSEILRMVREHLYKETGGEEQPIGMRGKLYAPEVLLNFMLSQTAACDRATDSSSVKKAGKETVAGAMHIMRMDGGFVHSSHQQRPNGQQRVQSANALHELSFLLACDAQAFGEAVFDAHAAINRVGMLRGYGNAIVAQAAQAFIESVM